LPNGFVAGECLRVCLNEDECQRLKHLVGRSHLELLGYVVDLESGEVYDWLRKTSDDANVEFEVLQVLLAHYSKAEPVERASKLARFADLPGGRAHEGAFLQRAVRPILWKKSQQLRKTPYSSSTMSVILEFLSF
jgi:hypothetical protein